MDRSWLDDVDEPVRALLSGSKGDFQNCIPSEITDQWLQEIDHSKRKRLGKASVQRFLAGALARAIYQTVSSVAPDPGIMARWILIFDRWLKQGSVSHELSRLLNPVAKSPLNLLQLEEELGAVRSAGVEQPDLELSRKPLVVDFVKQFQDSVASQPKLSNAIGKEQLKKMVLRSAAAASLHEIDLAGRGDREETAGEIQLEFALPPEPQPAGAEAREPQDTPSPSAPPKRSPLETRSDAGAGAKTRPPSKGLMVSHWLEDRLEQVLDMTAVLETDADYWYGFRIGREARAGATTKSFAEPAELTRKEKSIVFLEVTSELLGPEKFERRRVVYTRGQGLPDQYFHLTTREIGAGSAPLRIQIVHDNLPVYTQNWSLRLAQGAVVSAPPKPADPDQAPPVRDLGAAADLGPLFHNTFRIKCDRERMEILSPYMQSWPGSVPRLMHAPQDRIVEARRTFKEFAEKWGDTESFTEGEEKEAAGSFLRDMAVWGRDCYDMIFDDRNQPLRHALERVPVGSLLTIDTEQPSFPWEWLFLGETPGSGEDFLEGDALDKFLSGFWGIRFGISILPGTSTNRIGLQPVLANAEATRVFSSINPTAYPETAKANLEFVESLPRSYGQVKTEIAQGREATVELLRKSAAAQTAPHLIYFYCHHRAGRITNIYGYLKDQESVLHLLGEEEDELSVTDLKHDYKLAPFPVPQTPLVFLNACGTAQGQDFHPSGFVPYFTGQLLASSVICTLAEIPAGQGLKMAQNFFQLWFRGMSAATALQFLRRQWLQERLSPFAMYYSLNGIAHLTLARRLQP